jgi:hypothetical protein
MNEVRFRELLLDELIMRCTEIEHHCPGVICNIRREPISTGGDWWIVTAALSVREVGNRFGLGDSAQTPFADPSNAATFINGLAEGLRLTGKWK